MTDDEEQQLRAVALENARAVMQVRQRVEAELRDAKATLEDERRDLEILNQTAALFVAQLDLETLVQAITDAATQLTAADFGAFFYTAKDPTGGVFTLFTLSGAPREAFERFGEPRATPLFAATFEGREGVIRIADVRKDPRYGHWGPHHGMPEGHLPVCSYLAIPVLLRSSEVVGGLFFGHAKPDMFTERHERLLVSVAAQAGIAIDNAQMYEEAKRAAAAREVLLEAERSARAEVERVSRMKDEFLATLSHELRTPLNAILGWSEMLLPRATDDFARGLETIARNAHAQAQLIDDLLDMNRIISGKVRLDVQRLDLAGIIDAVLDSVRPSADAKTIRLRKILDPHAGPVFGDPQRLQQIVWNLVSNSLKFTPKAGKVDVVLRRINSHVEIRVVDSGMGIAAEFLPHVFERFRQADSSTTRKHGGLGLGLAIVKHLVELHGGRITAESLGAHQGATFIVSLPIRAIVESEEPHPTTPRKSTLRDLTFQLTGVRVLVVDDEVDSRELVASVLASVGATTVLAGSVEEALARIAEDTFDLIISDIGMPERDGYQLMRAVRALPPERGGKTPAIAVTAFARSEDRTRALLSGFQVHLSKPIEPHELVVTAGSLTGKVDVT